MTPWNKTTVRNSLVEAISPMVGAAGFRFKKSAEAFVRPIDSGRQELGLPLVDYNPVFEFSFTLCIRLDAVQAIVNRFSGSPPKYHANTLTSITQLEHLGLHGEPGRGAKFRIAEESDLAAIMPDLHAIVSERVLPFFEEYRDVAALNRGLNPAGADQVHQVTAYPDRTAFDATNQPYRAMTGVTVAHLTRDPRRSVLIRAYRNQISEMPEHERRKFEDLVTYLS